MSMTTYQNRLYDQNQGNDRCVLNKLGMDYHIVAVTSDLCGLASDRWEVYWLAKAHEYYGECQRSIKSSHRSRQ